MVNLLDGPLQLRQVMNACEEVRKENQLGQNGDGEPSGGTSDQISHEIGLGLMWTTK